MEILFVATELAPIVKVGGLADVVTALSKALRVLGHRVTIVMPRFRAIEEAGVLLARRLTPLEVGSEKVIVLDGKLGSGVELTLLDAGDYYQRSGIYGEDEGNAPYPDNAARFGVFCRAVTELVRQKQAAGQPFDVVHVHDWPSAPVAYLMKQDAALAGIRTVLTIHNVAHQGIFPKEALASLGLSDAHFHAGGLEFFGGVSFLKAGAVAADVVTTVSETYARDILTDALGERFDGILRARPSPVLGITNGIDYAIWNPATDAALVARYDSEDPTSKTRSKSALLAELGLPTTIEKPLCVSLGRIGDQKGSDVLADAIARLAKLDVTVVVAGDGDAELEKKLERAIVRVGENGRYLGRVTEPSAHRLFGAADIVLLPSRYEPCGLVQMYAQRYGAIPVATRTGGFVDTVVDIDVDLETGTGVLFDSVAVEDLVGGVSRAVVAMRHPRFAWLRRRMMRLDLGWDRPARRYAQIYRGPVLAAKPTLSHAEP